jgi:hypothetical protein
MTTLADEFTTMFRREHRRVRDTLLDLIAAFEARDRERIARLLGETAALTGPHFRYEEEALYPGLVAIFGDEYVDKLLWDHDRAIGTAQALVDLARSDPLSDRDVATAVRYIRGILPHVSDCDGLSIMVELLAEPKVRAVLDARDRSLAAGLDLLRWTAEVRGRPAVRPATRASSAAPGGAA